jgi:hypothetical protein
MQSRNAPPPASRKYLCFLSLAGDVPEPHRVWFFSPARAVAVRLWRGAAGYPAAGGRGAGQRYTATAPTGYPAGGGAARGRGGGRGSYYAGGRARYYPAAGGGGRYQAGATRRALPGGGATRRAAARAGLLGGRATRRRRGGARWARAGLPIGGAGGGAGQKKARPVGRARRGRRGWAIGAGGPVRLPKPRRTRPWEPARKGGKSRGTSARPHVLFRRGGGRNRLPRFQSPRVP